MKKSYHTIGALTTVAALGFIAGRLVTPVASIAAPPPEGDQEIDPHAEWAAVAANPGPHHEHLNALVGTWEAKVRFRMDPAADWMESSGTVTREWVLDKRFLKEAVEATSPMGGGGTFQGLGYIGYDNAEGVYQSTWMENHSTAIINEVGSYDPGTRMMTFRGAHRHPMTGRTVLVRSEVNMKDPNRHIFNGYAIAEDGREYKSFEGTATRR